MQDSALTGSVAVAIVLVLATSFALWRRRRDGLLRPVAPVPAPSTAEGSAVAAWSGTRATAEGSAVEASSGTGATAGGPATLVDPGVLAALGVRPGTPATLVQFSSAFCAPCRATRRVLTEVTGLLDGVRHVEVDAESHLAEVRALGIWRTPTVLVVDADGRIVQRAAGVPARAQVVAAVAPLLTATPS